MIEVVFVCATLASGFGCLPTTGATECAKALTLLHQSVIIESDCYPIEMAPGTIYAPATSPLPVARP